MREVRQIFTGADMVHTMLGYPYDIIVREQKRGDKVILDIPFLIDLLREAKAAHCIKFDLEEADARICATEVNINKLLEGAYFSPNRDANIKNILELQESLTLLPMTKRTYGILSAISAHLASQGMSMRYLDAATAAIALDNNGTIITRGRQFDPVPELLVVNY